MRSRSPRWPCTGAGAISRRSASASLKEEREGVVAGLSGRLRRRVGQPVSRVSKLTPWAMWVADTLMIANAYGVFGAVALPFPDSLYVGNATQLMRAAMVSFALVFGLRMVGSKLRDIAEELRESRPLAAIVLDGSIVLVVVGAGVMLALSAAQLQAGFLGVAAGGSVVHLPTSVLFWIVAFLGAVSFAAGYLGNEPAIARIAGFDTLIETTRIELNTIGAQLARQLGVVRGWRARLKAIDERERLEIIEQHEHSERRGLRARRRQPARLRRGWSTRGCPGAGQAAVSGRSPWAAPGPKGHAGLWRACRPCGGPPGRPWRLDAPDRAHGQPLQGRGRLVEPRMPVPIAGSRTLTVPLRIGVALTESGSLSTTDPNRQSHQAVLALCDWLADYSGGGARPDRRRALRRPRRGDRPRPRRRRAQADRAAASLRRERRRRHPAHPRHRATLPTASRAPGTASSPCP